MVDERIEKLAILCIHYSIAVKPKEKVLISGSVAAAPLINELYKECLLSDAYPMVMPQLETDYTFFKYAKEHQLTYVSPFEKFLIENVNAQIGVFCEPNPKRLTNIAPEKMRLRATSRKELVKIRIKREAEGKLRWTALPYPIEAQAQEAEMAMLEYEDFVYGSCFVDKEDPAGEWKKIHEEQEGICSFLNKATEIHFIGEDTDLKLSVKGRKWINCSGKNNMPDGEVFTGPIENSANGTIRFNFPGIYGGREIEDVKLKFKDGKVVKASASKGEEFLHEILKVEGANRIGEIAIGTNYAINRFTKNMLFDEKMGGTIHMALGSSIPESGGVNVSAVHWDLLKNMKKDGEIYADRKLFYKNGKFLI